MDGIACLPAPWESALQIHSLPQPYYDFIIFPLYSVSDFPVWDTSIAFYLYRSYHSYPVTGIVTVKHFGEKISFWPWKALSCRSSHVGCQLWDATYLCVLVCKSHFIFSIQFWSLPIPDWFDSVKEFLFIFRQVCQNVELLLFPFVFLTYVLLISICPCERDKVVSSMRKASGRISALKISSKMSHSSVGFYCPWLSV